MKEEGREGWVRVCAVVRGGGVGRWGRREEERGKF